MTIMMYLLSGATMISCRCERRPRTSKKEATEFDRAVRSSVLTELFELLTGIQFSHCTLGVNRQLTNQRSIVQCCLVVHTRTNGNAFGVNDNQAWMISKRRSTHHQSTLARHANLPVHDYLGHLSTFECA